MQRNNRGVGVSLTGGLGNQLFQVAAALSISNKRKIVLISSYGKPRLSKSNEPEVYALITDEIWCERYEAKGNWFASKSLGYVLRMGVMPKFWEKGLVKKLIKLFANLIVSIDCRKKFRLLIGSGVGYFLIPSSKNFTLLVGYFQSYRWASQKDVYSKLYSLKPRGHNPELDNLSVLSITSKPLIVHIRLGDYLSEDKFGVPSPEYYKSAISMISKKIEFKEIWVFSDSMSIARKMIEFSPSTKVRWIGQIDDSSASTFQAMRLGVGYIIGNSTFSWWAAFLRFNPNAPVIAPSPWFRGMDEPVELIPENWIRIGADYLGNFNKTGILNL